MTIRPDTTVAEIATTLPRSIPVFERYGIDFCCRGNRSLGDACAEKNVALEDVRRNLELLEAAAPDAGEDWNASTPSALIRHIVDHYHATLRKDLIEFGGLLEKVFAAHSERHGATLGPLRAMFRGLSVELEPHMQKEEQVLFPHIQDLEAVEAGARHPGTVRLGLAHAATQMMRQEHDGAGAALAEMRTLTGGYVPPEDACVSFRALYAGLVRLEADLHRHIHLENNILFTRALRIEEEAIRTVRT